MHVDTHVEWAQTCSPTRERGDFSAVRPTCVLTVAARDHLRDRLGVARVRPLHVLLGHRHPDKAAFCEVTQAASDLQPHGSERRLLDLADTGRARFLEGFAWASAYREDLAVYAQMMEQSKAIQSVLKSEGLHAGVCASLQATLAPRTAPAHEPPALPTGSWNRSRYKPPRSRPAQPGWRPPTSSNRCSENTNVHRTRLPC